ncbi:MAG: MarR family transcriptional regulator [Myxococcota bacterium]
MPKKRRPFDRKRLAAAKAGVTSELLFRAARRLNEHALSLLPPGPGPTPRPAHMALFPHIELEGTRPSALAEALGISKQAVGQLVDDLQAMGIVERRADPTDRRARLVCFTEAGFESMLQGLEHLRAMDRWMREDLGDDLDALHDILERIVKRLDEVE